MKPIGTRYKRSCRACPHYSLGRVVWLVTSTAAAPSLLLRQKAAGNSIKNVHSLQKGLPPVKSRDVCVVLAPCNGQDYAAAKRLADNGNTVVLVNGLAKVWMTKPIHIL